MDAWSLMAGSGALLAGFQAAQDKAKKAQEDEDERQWKNQQRQRMMEEHNQQMLDQKYQRSLRPAQEEEARMRRAALIRGENRAQAVDEYNNYDVKPNVGPDAGGAMNSVMGLAGMPIGVGGASGSAIQAPIKTKLLIPRNLAREEQKFQSDQSNKESILNARDAAQNLREETLKFQQTRALGQDVGRGILNPQRIGPGGVVESSAYNVAPKALKSGGGGSSGRGGGGLGKSKAAYDQWILKNPKATADQKQQAAKNLGWTDSPIIDSSRTVKDPVSAERNKQYDILQTARIKKKADAYDETPITDADIDADLAQADRIARKKMGIIGGANPSGIRPGLQQFGAQVLAIGNQLNR